MVSRKLKLFFDRGETISLEFPVSACFALR